jgi:hypothetical protein
MNDNLQNQTSTRRMNRRQRIEVRRATSGSNYGNPWIAGVVLVLLGTAFLLHNMGISTLDNWWALFILLPALGSLSAAWRSYQETGGQLTMAAQAALFIGLILLGMTAAFLFEINLTYIGPMFFLVAGGYLIYKALRSQEN